MERLGDFLNEIDPSDAPATTGILIDGRSILNQYHEQIGGPNPSADSKSAIDSGTRRQPYSLKARWITYPSGWVWNLRKKGSESWQIIVFPDRFVRLPNPD